VQTKNINIILINIIIIGIIMLHNE